MRRAPVAPHAAPHAAFREGTEALLRAEVHAAIRLLERAVALDPFRVAARFNLAVALRLAGLTHRALYHATAAAQLAPGSAPAHAHLGMLWQLDAQPERAEAAFRAALACDAEDRAACLAYGALLRLEGRDAEAVDLFERAARPGESALPLVLRERALGLLLDARSHTAAPAAPAAHARVAAVCTVQVVSEVMTDDAARPRVLLPEPATPEPSRAAHFAPSRNPTREVTADEAARLVHAARRIVVLTGAGASAECGLATRKDLWRRFDRDDAVSISRASESVSTLWRVVRAFLGDRTYAPGAAHFVLANLPRLEGIITQNVDDLHQRADPEARAGRAPRCPVIELHGTLERTRCDACGASGPSASACLTRAPGVLPPRCTACGRADLRPDVVLFGEWVAPDRLAAAIELVARCDLLLVVGCSMDVTPASELPRLAARAGATVLEVKRSASRISEPVGAHLLRGPAGAVLPALYRALARLEPLPEVELPLPSPGPETVAPVPFAPVRVPEALSISSEYRVGRWLKKPGDRVLEGEALVEIDLDKVCVELFAPQSGTLRATFVNEGSVIVEGETVGEIEPSEPSARVYPRESRLGTRRDPYRPFTEALLTDYGPATGEVRALLRTLPCARWLAPDSELATLGPDARAWLEARIDEHLAGLAQFDEDREPPASLALWVTRDPWEGLARWSRAWGVRPGMPGPERPVPSAKRWVAALRRAVARTEAPPGATPPRDVVDALNAAFAPSLAASPFAGRAFEAPPWQLAYQSLRSLIAGAPRDQRCPFRPLLDIWLRGAWPFALPDAIAVYVPPSFISRRSTLDDRIEPAMPGLPWLDRTAHRSLGALLLAPDAALYAPVGA